MDRYGEHLDERRELVQHDGHFLAGRKLLRLLRLDERVLRRRQRRARGAQLSSKRCWKASHRRGGIQEKLSGSCFSATNVSLPRWRSKTRVFHKLPWSAIEAS